MDTLTGYLAVVAVSISRRVARYTSDDADGRRPNKNAVGSAADAVAFQMRHAVSHFSLLLPLMHANCMTRALTSSGFLASISDVLVSCASTSKKDGSPLGGKDGGGRNAAKRNARRMSKMPTISEIERTLFVVVEALSQKKQFFVRKPLVVIESLLPALAMWPRPSVIDPGTRILAMKILSDSIALLFGATSETEGVLNFVITQLLQVQANPHVRRASPPVRVEDSPYRGAALPGTARCAERAWCISARCTLLEWQAK